MAIIGKIRNKGGLLIAIVVGIALLSFILGDLLGPGGSLLSGGQSDIAEIAGEKIPAINFEDKVQEAIENYKQQSDKTSINQSTIDLIREQTWTQLLNEIILGKEYNETGVAVHPDEIFDLVTGNNPHPSIVQAFSNPKTGQFNSTDVLNFLKNMDNDASGKTRAQWLPFERAIKKDRTATKYYSLIKKGLFVTSLEAKADYEYKNNFAKVNYVLIRYNLIPDSALKITESDIKKYYNDHKQEHIQETSRTIEYITFDVFPSPDDSLTVKEWVDRIYGEFKEVKGYEENVSFVNINADTRHLDKFYKNGELSNTIDSIMHAVDTGYIAGPFIEDNSYKMSKLLDVKMRPDSVKARHILLTPSTAEDTSYLASADSIKELIINGADFAALARSVSKDPGSAVEGGELGWFAEGTMVKQFNDSCFSGSAGDLMIVRTQFGAHIIEILEATKPIKKIKVGIVDRKIEPSSKTFAGIYAKVNKFTGSNTTRELFEASAEKQGLVTRVADNLKPGDKAIIGLESPRELVRWAFKVKKGEVSGPFELENRFVAAVLLDIKEKGLASLEDIRTEMEIGAKNKKKAEYIIGKIKENDDKNIEDLAQNLTSNNAEFKVTVEKIDRIAFSSYNLPGVGREPQLIGTIFGSKAGVLSGPVEGNQGVYMFVTEEFTPAPPVQDFTANQLRLINDLNARVDYEVFNALQKKAKVIDNRDVFY